MMISKQSQLRIKQLRVRAWFHIVTAVVYVSGALFCAIKDIIVGVVLFIVFTVVSIRIVVKSAEELSRLNEDDPNIGPQAGA